MINFDRLLSMTVHQPVETLIRNVKHLSRLLPDDFTVRIIAGTLKLAQKGLERDKFELKVQFF